MLTSTERLTIEREFRAYLNNPESPSVGTPGLILADDQAISNRWGEVPAAFGGDQSVPDEIKRIRRNGITSLTREMIYSTLSSVTAEELEPETIVALIYAWGVGSSGSPTRDDEEIVKATHKIDWPNLRAFVLDYLIGMEHLSVDAYNRLLTPDPFGGIRGIGLAYATKLFRFLNLRTEMEGVQCQILDSMVRSNLTKIRGLIGPIFGPSLQWVNGWLIPERLSYWDYERYCEALEVMAAAMSAVHCVPYTAEDVEGWLWSQ
jgi:hypothetical protein